MKIMHLSDLHLGKNLNGFSLYEDQRHIHKQILQIAKEEAIDAVMIAGDVFDKSVPTNQAIQLFDEFLTSWAELHLPVFIISGNHDSAQRVAFGTSIDAFPKKDSSASVIAPLLVTIKSDTE